MITPVWFNRNLVCRYNRVDSHQPELFYKQRLLSYNALVSGSFIPSFNELSQSQLQILSAHILRLLSKISECSLDYFIYSFKQDGVIHLFTIIYK